MIPGSGTWHVAEDQSFLFPPDSGKRFHISELLDRENRHGDIA